MTKDKLIDIVFTEWSASFRNSDKKTKNARQNFEDLFQKWKDVDATFEDLYETFLPKAIKVHLPPPAVTRRVYKSLKHQMDRTEKEFADEWSSSIQAIGTEVFFEFFPATPLDHDSEPKVYGSMSKSEYQAQRRYSEQFPTLDTTELIKQWKEQQEYNVNIDEILDDVLGDK